MTIKHMRGFAAALFGAVAASFASPASAGFIGDEVHAERLTGTILVNSIDFVVGDGIEWNEGFFRLDVTDNALKFIFPVANFGSIKVKIEGLQFVEEPSKPLEIVSIAPTLIRGGSFGPFLERVSGGRNRKTIP